MAFVFDCGCLVGTSRDELGRSAKKTPSSLAPGVHDSGALHRCFPVRIQGRGQDFRANQERIRTAQFANRDKRLLLRHRRRKTGGSGSLSRSPSRQHPANSRSILELCRSDQAKSPHPKTQWRWVESVANLSL
jgi:hypothetical protein